MKKESVHLERLPPETFWEALRGYLSQRLRMIAAFVSLLGLFLLVLALSHAPLDAALYGTLLCVCAGGLLLLPGFFDYWRKHAALRALLRRGGTGLQQLPSPTGLLERDWAELARLLERRYAELRERQAHERAEADRYYTTWAHQIKTPLSAMRLLLQEEGGGPLSAELLPELFKVEQYVGMVLEYLRLGQGTDDLLPVQCDLAGIVRAAVRRTSTLFIHKKIALSLGEISCPVVTDRKWLAFVIEQLLTNAVKYTPSGTVSILLEPGSRLVIEDTGIGIRPQDLPRIFDWGFTGVNGREEERSTGVGLYLCRRVLNLLGHGISIDSQPGRGTRVTLNLSREELLIE